MTLDRHFNPYRLPERTQQCPYDLYAEMRGEDGLQHSEEFNGFYVVSRYQDVSQVLLDGEHFGVSEGVGLMGPVGFILPETDGPLHRRYRRNINPWFRRSAVEPFEGDVRALASALLDSLEERDEIEFVTEVCRRLVFLVNSKVVLTVDDEHFDHLQELIGFYTYDPSRAHEVIEGMRKFASADIARRRAEPPRGDAHLMT
jgi:cytochrome P450